MNHLTLHLTVIASEARRSMRRRGYSQRCMDCRVAPLLAMTLVLKGARR